MRGLALVSAKACELALKHVGDVDVVICVRPTDEPDLADIPRLEPFFVQRLR